MKTRLVFLTLAFAMGLSSAAVSQGQAAGGSNSAGKGRAVLVELFTSEGCSSCPPADEFLRQINGLTTPSGMLIVALSEHVTYWDSGGWKDPYSAPVYTNRQGSYASRFGLDSVYTPQAVINGRAQVNGSSRKAVLNAIDSPASDPPLKLHILSAEIAGKVLTIKYSVTEEGQGPKADIFAVVAADAAASKVLRGENAGTTLAHAAVARSLDHIATVQGGSEERTAQLTLSNGFVPSPSTHLVLFAQASGMGRVLSVATTPLK
ncbi:MAG TPA: DUF1223 domain-containing protein [Acidisarcina sp.]